MRKSSGSPLEGSLSRLMALREHFDSQTPHPMHFSARMLASPLSVIARTGRNPRIRRQALQSSLIGHIAGGRQHRHAEYAVPPHGRATALAAVAHAVVPAAHGVLEPRGVDMPAVILCFENVQCLILADPACTSVLCSRTKLTKGSPIHMHTSTGSQWSSLLSLQDRKKGYAVRAVQDQVSGVLVWNDPFQVRQADIVVNVDEGPASSSLTTLP